MAFPFKRVLCPVDFDQSAGNALALAHQMARESGATVTVFHVVSTVAAPSDAPVFIDYNALEEAALKKLEEIVKKHLGDVKHEIAIKVGDVATAILRAEKEYSADVVVMATHGRRGLARVFLGSVAEMVLRESTCPVLTLRGPLSDRNSVGHWMTRNVVAATPDEKLAIASARMREGGYRSLPVMDGGKIVGTITAVDAGAHPPEARVTQAMTAQVVTVSPETPIVRAAALLVEHKVDALPVVMGNELVGLITSTDLMKVLTEEK